MSEAARDVLAERQRQIIIAELERLDRAAAAAQADGGVIDGANRATSGTIGQP